ncbi:hypothetical protein E9677_17700 [Rhizobium rhizophilum]|uniref:Uncharacterized protein n=1 Tax=Rhizobium rhizophilum TaxID=1850373 RepID=A0ABY2QST9_9HYPH|nr:hypothetical protein E9677_17700 [Rhizobium rhizophilum]
MVISRRQFLRASIHVVSLAPLVAGLLGMTGFARNAAAQGKGNDNGNDGGNGNGNSGGNGNGGSGGQGGGGQGGGGKSRDAYDRSSVGQSPRDDKSNGPSVGGSSTRVRHSTGIEEAITNGRYIMRDKWGRTIINRAATAADRRRLRSLIN